MKKDFEEQLKKINEELTPVLTEMFKDVDIKTAIIFFSGLTKNLLDELDDDGFSKIIIKYIKD